MVDAEAAEEEAVAVVVAVECASPSRRESARATTAASLTNKCQTPSFVMIDCC